jgi:molybdopterin synthase catalytic subunit
MSICVEIHDGPLALASCWRPRGAGAVVCFEGIVRPIEGEVTIAGLAYQTYDPMAEKELRRLATEAAQRHQLLAVWVEHSRGLVATHECSFRLRVASQHRKEALAAMDWFIDQMKKVVPIWKSPVLSPQDKVGR